MKRYASGRRHHWLGLWMSAWLAGCTAGPPEARSQNSAESASPLSAEPKEVAVQNAIPLTSASAHQADLADSRRFADLSKSLSEPDRYFFSDNLISNETSYLDVANALSRETKAGGVYVGVGPEQNFSYIAITRPSTAFILDIRRDNLLLHLLYRACFEEARSRSHFAALLLGRSLAEAHDNASDANLDAVLALAQKEPTSRESFEAIHGTLSRRLDGYGIALSKKDHETIHKMHKAFFEAQLGLRFALHEKNGRLYPTLRDNLAARSPDGKRGSFLANEDDFRFVQGLQKAGRLVPIVGDFAGDHALAQLASYLRSEELAVSTFYVSNVEQYLLEPEKYAAWVRNITALPKNEHSVFVRAYLDQGRRHPRQREGQRTASAVFKMSEFEEKLGKQKTTTFWVLSNDNMLVP